MPVSERPRIGLVGVRETEWLVRRIVAAGGRVDLLEPDSRRSCRSSTGPVATYASLADLRPHVDVVVTRLDDATALRAVAVELAATAQSATPGQVVLDLSPVAPWTFRDIATASAASGVELFGGAVVNAPGQGARGSTLYLDAAATHTPRLNEAVAALADHVLAVGDPGSAKAMAILAGLLVGVNTAALREALAIGRAAGIERGLLIELLGKGSGATAVMEGDAIDADTSEHRRGLLRAVDTAWRVDHSVLFGALGIASLWADRAGSHALPLADSRRR